jgi:hypothetical protein
MDWDSPSREAHPRGCGASGGRGSTETPAAETKIDQQTTQAPAKEPTTKSEDNQRSAAPNAADPQKEPESSPDRQRNKGNEAEGVGKTDEPDKAKEPAKTNAA